MKLLLHYLSRYKWLIVLCLFLAAINQIFSLMYPLILGKMIIDPYAKQPHKWAESQFLWGTGKALLTIMGTAMISRIAKAFQDYSMNVIIQRSGAEMYTDGLKHALSLPYQDFEDKSSGETLSTLQKVRTDSQNFINVFVNVFVMVLIGLIFVMVYAFVLNPSLPVIYIIGSLTLGFLINVLSKKIKSIQKNITKETNTLAGATTESLRNIELVKSLGLTTQEIRRLNSTTLKILSLELKKVRSIRTISFVQGTFVNFLQQAVYFTLLYLLFSDKLTLGDLVTMQFYSFFIFGPLQEIGSVIIAYREAEASLNNMKALLVKPIEYIPSKPEALNTIKNLRFNNVSFQHLSANTPALEDVSFEVKTGETVAFVGPSGSGKTTMVKLLVGLYHPVKGRIYYNNHADNDIDFEELRRQIGLVTQDPQLFSGTIKENLLFVNPGATEADMQTALDQAACQNLLARAEKGIDTMIGEGGLKLSGGERQRLSIARALLRKPKLMIFDEATSALDSLTEEEISKTVRSITAQREHITIMIAHRLSTIMHADRIFVLEKGNIIETGNHNSLLEEKGLYYAMWRQQIGERKTPAINSNGNGGVLQHNVLK